MRRNNVAIMELMTPDHTDRVKNKHVKDVSL